MAGFRWAAVREVLTVALAFLGLLLCARIFTGCSSTQKSLEAEAAYTAQQLQCVDRNDTRPAIDECRRLVRERWGIKDVVPDAGSDAGKDGH